MILSKENQIVNSSGSFPTWAPFEGSSGLSRTEIMELIKRAEESDPVTLTKEPSQEMKNSRTFGIWVPVTGQSDYSRSKLIQDVKKSETEEFFKSLSRRPYVQKNLGRDGHIPTIEVELGLLDIEDRLHRGTHSNPLFESATFTALFDTGAEMSVIAEELVSHNCLDACFLQDNRRWIYANVTIRGTNAKLVGVPFRIDPARSLPNQQPVVLLGQQKCLAFLDYRSVPRSIGHTTDQQYGIISLNRLYNNYTGHIDNL
eukprot:TRINITY_DN4134_c0_g1_i2.p1 TRINITY_DN4134_c0_g1~~TRINITY_DN4134_c0_g1_i2.p1  ORF type:complete len:258 (-),score=30.29 TRINITY_DN4134_c0_g1_i2:33-806(-)